MKSMNYKKKIKEKLNNYMFCKTKKHKWKRHFESKGKNFFHLSKYYWQPKVILRACSKPNHKKIRWLRKNYKFCKVNIQLCRSKTINLDKLVQKNRMQINNSSKILKGYKNK